MSIHITSKKKRRKKVVLTSRITNLELVEINSCVRGYHDYLDIWDATVDEVLILRESLTTAERSYSLQPGSYCRIIHEKRSQQGIC